MRKQNCEEAIINSRLRYLDDSSRVRSDANRHLHAAEAFCKPCNGLDTTHGYDVCALELPSAFHMLVFYVAGRVGGGGKHSDKHFCFHDHVISF